MDDNGDRGAGSIRRYRWALFGVLTLVFLLVAVGARHREQGALDERVGAAERFAEDRASAAFSAITTKDVARPMIGPAYRDVIVPVQAEVMTDPGVARVRIWSPDGTLLFSTDERETIGRVRLADDLAISTALGGRTTSRLVTIPYRPATVGPEAIGTDLFQTFSPLHVADRVSIQGAVETDQFWEPIRADASSPWRTVQRLLLALAALSAVVAIALFRVRPRGSSIALADESLMLPAFQTERSGDRGASAAMANADHEPPVRDKEDAKSDLEGTDADLARDASLAALEQRVGAAERRAQDAEKRLQKLSDEVAAAPGDAGVSTPSGPGGDSSSPKPDREPEPEDPLAPDQGLPQAQATELRARLARTAARKKPGGGREDA
jgi:hypothetical protein